jgi:hypothetical protein
MSSVTLEEVVIRQGMASDAIYAGHLFTDIREMGATELASVIPFCVSPFLSLFVHETLVKLRAIDPATSTALSTNVQQIVARSRHSLKLFEDTRRGVDGQLEYFHDVLLPSHRNYFHDLVRFKAFRFLATDLGLYRYNGHLISTTHAANFHMGQEPQIILTMTRTELRAIYEEYGHFIATLGGRLGTPGRTFVSHLDPGKFAPRVEDVRSERYYRQIFDGPANPDLNALLTVFQSMVNFACLVSAGGSGTADYSAFKIRFLTLYQVLGSLRILRDDQMRVLTSRSAQFVDTLLGSPTAQLILARPAKPFRNTLMHYNLDSRVDTSRIDVSAPLFGLVPIYFPAYDAESFGAAIDTCIGDVATTMDKWAELN